MRGYVLTVDGQPLCIFPFEGKHAKDLPDIGLSRFDMRHPDNDMSIPATIERSPVQVNHWGACYVSDSVRSFVVEDFVQLSDEMSADLAEIAQDNEGVNPTDFYGDNDKPPSLPTEEPEFYFVERHYIVDRIMTYKIPRSDDIEDGEAATELVYHGATDDLRPFAVGFREEEYDDGGHFHVDVVEQSEAEVDPDSLHGPRVVVTVEGGLVQNVMSDQESVEVLVMDFDNQAEVEKWENLWTAKDKNFYDPTGVAKAFDAEDAETSCNESEG